MPGRQQQPTRLYKGQTAQAEHAEEVEAAGNAGRICWGRRVAGLKVGFYHRVHREGTERTEEPCDAQQAEGAQRRIKACGAREEAQRDFRQRARAEKIAGRGRMRGTD
jgi:hypothetical protein